MSICSPKLSIYREIKQQKSGNLALPEPCIPVTVPFGMVTPQHPTTNLGHRDTAQPSIPLHPHCKPAAFCLSLLLFLLLDGIVENGEDHKNVVLLYQDSRSELCREQSAWLLHWLRSTIPVVLLPQSCCSCDHTSRPRGSKRCFFFSFFLSAPKIKKNDMDIIIPSVTVPAQQEEDTKA